MSKRKVHLIRVDADGDTGHVECWQRRVVRPYRVGYRDGELITCKRCKRAYALWLEAK